MIIANCGRMQESYRHLIFVPFVAHRSKPPKMLFHQHGGFLSYLSGIFVTKVREGSQRGVETPKEALLQEKLSASLSS